MDRQLLLEFWNNEAMRLELQQFLLAHLDQLGLNKVYNKEDTHGIADAREVIIEAFKQLDEEFVRKPEKKDKINMAR